MESSSLTSRGRRIKFFGMALALTAIVVVGYVTVNNNEPAAMSLEKAQALVMERMDAAAVSKLPLESELNVPQDAEVVSDEQIGDEEAEESKDDYNGLFSQAVSGDSDNEFDSPVQFEHDEDGQKYIPEIEEGVKVTDEGDQAGAVEKLDVGKDARFNRHKCVNYRRCRRTCKKDCRRHYFRKCYNTAYCKCYRLKGKLAIHRCKVYRRRQCQRMYTIRCINNCKHVCKTIRRCYHCPAGHVGRKCGRKCRNWGHKPRYCSCRCRRCYNVCRMFCKKWVPRRYLSVGPWYRYWNGRDHFYTMNAREIGVGLRPGQKGKHGYTFEGIQCYLGRSRAHGLIPLYRYWNGYDHFYTANAAEIGTTRPGQKGRHGYTSEGVTGYCLKHRRGNSVPLYRYWNGREHFYTTNIREIGTSRPGQVGRHGYRSEGISCYVFPGKKAYLA